MANALYDSGREGFGDGSFSWTGSTIKSALVGVGYIPDLAGDKFLADVPGGEIIATSTALTSTSIPGGVADADNVTFSAVSGAQAKYILIYEDTGSPATSRLIACIDTATGLPVIPNGGDITISWDTGANKIFKL